MTNNIYLIDEDGKLKPMAEKPYESEDLLQELLGQFPAVLAGEQISTGEPRRWLLISREMDIPDEEGGMGRWSLDHLFLDQDGVPTLVEVKRSSDTRIRREVVGQMLDYAANAVVYWPLETVRAKFEAEREQKGEDPAQLIAELVGDGMAEGDPVDEFWNRVKTNLRAGKVRLVFVADSIPSELRRIVEFLNEQMDPAEVLGIEISQFVGEGLKTLVPRVVGQTAAAEQTKGKRKSLNENQRMRLEFWTAFKEYLTTNTTLKSNAPLTQCYMGHPINKSGATFYSIFAIWDSVSRSYEKGELRVDLYLDEPDAKTLFETFKAEKDEIEQELGSKLTWYTAESGKTFRIYVQQSVDAYDRQKWPEYWEWLRTRLGKFYKVFEPRLVT